MNTPTSRRKLQIGGLLLGASTLIGTAACSAPESQSTTRETITTEPTMSPAPTGAGIEQYDVVLLGSPIWEVRAPMIMSTLTDSHDFTGKPFVTYAASGLGSIERDYATSCPGVRIGAGLAVRGEQVPQRRPDVETWLREARLPA